MERQKNGLVIDPAGEENRLAKIIAGMGVELKCVINTHGHADHATANKGLKEYFSISAGMHEADDDFISDKINRQKSFAELGLPHPDRADFRFEDNDLLRVGNKEKSLYYRLSVVICKRKLS